MMNLKLDADTQLFRHVPAAGGVSSPNPVWKLLLKAFSNAIVLLFFGLLILASYQSFRHTGSAWSIGIVLVNALFVTLFLARREAKSISTAPLAWCLSFGGTLLPLWMRPDSATFTGLSIAGDALQAAGLALIVVALLSLRRSFGIVPANRGIKVDGLYRFVRHPLYAGELVFLLGYAAWNPSAWNIALWLMELGLQTSRARFEESFLALDPVYSQYRTRVRYRFIPGLL